MASIDPSPVPLEMPDMFLLMSSSHVMGLSYHRWLSLVAALFLLLCALNPILTFGRVTFPLKYANHLLERLASDLNANREAIH